MTEPENPRHHGDAATGKVRTLAIIGAGTMGTGIAIAGLDAGLDVTLLEQDAVALQRGTTRIREHYARRVDAGKMNADTATDCQTRLQATTDWNALAQTDLVIEAVFEDLAVKREVFSRLDLIARPGVILATNTSYLDVDAIAAVTSRPRDVAKRMGKLPVVTGNAFGFVGNRIFSAYRRQCEFMLEEGALPEQVDAALKTIGFAMGPFAVADMSGLDIAWRMRQSQAATRDPQARMDSRARKEDPVTWARKRGTQALQADLGWLAKVSGPGFVAGDPRHLLKETA